VSKRKPKRSDQKNTEYAYQILIKAMQEHPEIEQTLWAGACWTALVNGYLNSGVSFEEFDVDWRCAYDHYRKWWDK